MATLSARRQMTYSLEVQYGWSPYDHLAPILDWDATYPSRRAAEQALARGISAQGTCAKLSSYVRVDIVRSDGRRWPWSTRSAS